MKLLQLTDLNVTGWMNIDLVGVIISSGTVCLVTLYIFLRVLHLQFFQLSSFSREHVSNKTSYPFPLDVQMNACIRGENLERR